MGRPRKQRRQPHGSAWHWKQTDCWYFTLPGTKKRVPLFDQSDQHIRGLSNRSAAEEALARARLADADSQADAGLPRVRGWWRRFAQSICNTVNGASPVVRSASRITWPPPLISMTFVAIAVHCVSRN